MAVLGPTVLAWPEGPDLRPGGPVFILTWYHIADGGIL